SPQHCLGQVKKLLESADIDNRPEGDIRGGLLPHAGWIYSGKLAAITLKVLATPQPPKTVVFFGADHSGRLQHAEVYDRGEWMTPLGPAPIDTQAAEALIASGPPFRANRTAHDYEHSIEVQIPLLQALCPDAMILPITVSHADIAVETGRALPGALSGLDYRWVIAGSTDLTHHGGPQFGSPGGTGQAGLDYSVGNDRKILDLIEALEVDEIIPHATAHRNACGAGAIAATMAACKQLGATTGHTLEYTNSQEVMRQLAPDRNDDITVGYASVVFA
ncbi:MAG: AmmeMemoRadiSam system protein B, partial [Phycisphaerae bacterium]|nr:AmmeMemoRadiSam system protein B [Phycisphaerae bacterium]